MSDAPETMTINGQVHTCITSVFQEEALSLIDALVKDGVPGKLRPGRAYIMRPPEFSEDTPEARRRKRGAMRLHIVTIWLVGEIEKADRTYRP